MKKRGYGRKKHFKKQSDSLVPRFEAFESGVSMVDKARRMALNRARRKEEALDRWRIRKMESHGYCSLDKHELLRLEQLEALRLEEALPVFASDYDESLVEYLPYTKDGFDDE